MGISTIMIRRGVSGLAILFLILMMAAPAGADIDYTFQWDPNHPNDNVVSYRFYWSTASGDYSTGSMDEIPNVNDVIPGTSQVFDPDAPQYTKSFADPPPGEYIDVMYFVVTAVDDKGYESDYSLEVDTVAPQITSTPTVVSLSDTTAAISWTTDKPGTSVVEYGPDTNYGSEAPSPASATYQTSHSVTIEGLTAETTYHFRVYSVNELGIGPAHSTVDRNPSADDTFTTLAVGDTTPPVITDIPTVTGKTDTTATIAWTTDEPADSTVDYGLTTAYGSSQSLASYVSSHSVQLQGLDPDTTYQFRVGSSDVAGNGPTLSADYSFSTDPTPDTTPPVIVGTPTATSIGETSAVIEWTTDEPATSIVEFGLSGYERTKTQNEYVVNHQVTLTQLNAGSLYNFRAGSTDEAGNGPRFSSGDTFTTLAEEDTTAPVITNVPTATGISDTAATIVWQTDELGNSQVRYGTTAAAWTDLPNVVNNAELVSQHSVTLTNLTDSQTYYFRVGSTDADGNSPDPVYPDDNNPSNTTYSFTTQADATAPTVISAPTVTGLTDTTATIAWDTDESANSQVRYDTVSGTWGTYAAGKTSTAFGTHHSVTLTGLDDQQLYYFRVGNTDAGGNGPDPAYTDDNNPTNTELSFTTQTDQTPPTITSPPTATGIANDSAVIAWATDEPANSLVRYDTSSAAWDGYALSRNNADMVSQHSVTLTGLSGSTTYYLRVGSTDVEQNGPTVSSEVSFTTDPDPDITPPQFTSSPTVTNKTYSSATIVWETDEPSNSQVQYGTAGGDWGDYAQSAENVEMVTSHSVTITGLSGSTPYYFRAGSTDGDGNGPAVSAEYSFTTTAAPDTTAPQIIAPPTVTLKTNETATIEWTTDEESNSLVQYGTESAAWGSYTRTQSSALMVVDHTLTLTNLSGGTPYYFRVGSTDASGNGPTTSVEVSFTTEPDPDTTPPQITAAPTVTNISDSGAIIAWSTNEPGNSQVRYGTASTAWENYPSSENDGELVSNHTVTLAGLAVDTLYYFRVGSTDAAGNGPVASAELTFRTQPVPDETPPQFVSPPTVTGRTQDSAIITWETDEPANSQVRYGTTSAAWDAYAQVENDAAMVTAHSVTLTGLTAETTYHFRAGSTDGDGNGPRTSAEYTFTTAAAPDTTAPQIISAPTVTSKSNESAVIEWTTNEESNSLIQYDVESRDWGDYAFNRNNAGMLVNHSVTLNGLLGETRYYFRVGSSDASGNGPTTSVEVSFATDPDPDTTPPQITSPPTVTQISSDSAIVSWSTDEPANSLVQYDTTSRDWGDYASTRSSALMQVNHSVTLTSLTPETRYYLRVGAIDASGNGPVTSVETTFTTEPLPDTTPPQFTSPPTVTSKTHNSAIIAWETNEPGNSLVQYGTDSALWDAYPLNENNADMRTLHSVTLTGLLANQTYYLRAGSIDAAGNGPAASGEISFTTNAAPDTTAPQITVPPTVTNKTNASAVIEWTTNEESNSQVQFDTQGSDWDSYAGSRSNALMVVGHSVTLTGLSGATRYYYRVGSTDASGNGPVVSGEVSFETAPDPDTTPPQFTAPPTVTQISNNSAVVAWSTNEPSNSLVQYGTTSADWDDYAASENDSEMAASHTVTLEGLTGETLYYLRVGSVDAAGNGPVSSAEITFTTDPDPDINPPRITTPPTVTTKSVGSATIAWETDEPSTSQVRFDRLSLGWEGYSHVASDSAMVTRHSVTLTGLDDPDAFLGCTSGGCTFYFMVGSTDAADNGPDPADPNSNNPFTEDSFVTEQLVDTTAPRVVSGPSITAVDAESVIIEWETDEPANSMVHFGEAPSAWADYPLSEEDAVLVTRHSVTLTGLTGSTAYYYRVGATDAAGNGPDSAPNGSNPSGEATFTTAAVIDTIAPTVSNVVVQKVTNSTALITWETDEPGNSQVRYALSSGNDWQTYTFQENDPDMLVNHSLTLANLQPETQYFFRVGSTDARGNGPDPSAEGTFTTDAGPDEAAPQIIYFAIEKTTDTTAVITWTTDEPGNSQVRFDTTSHPEWPDYAYSENDAGMTKTHSVTLTGLSPDTFYYLRVSSTDASGNNYDTSGKDVNPSIELGLKTGVADPPSIIVFPDTEYPDNYPKVDAENNFIEITYDELNMVNAREEAYYSFSPALTFGASIETVGAASQISAYRFLFESVAAETVYMLTVGGEVTDADGLSVAPAAVRINDNDQDDLPDDWEVAVGLDPTSDDTEAGQGKTGDLDGDGYSNYDEFLGRTDPTDEESYPDEAAPEIVSGPTVTSVDAVSAVIEWETDEAATSIVRYGEASGSWATYSDRLESEDLVTEHRVVLTDLDPATPYYFRAGSVDGFGNGPDQNPNATNPSSENGFETDPDLTAPVISGIAVESITSSSAVVTWQTDESADSQVRYGISGANWETYPFEAADAGLKTSHSVTLNHLQPDTAYYFRVGSTDAVGNGPAPTSEQQFSTIEGADVSAPQIFNLQVQADSGVTAVVTWQTDEPADSRVGYDTVSRQWPGYAAVEETSGMVTDHRMTLIGLQPDTQYFVRASSADAAGNDADTAIDDLNPSQELEFTTGTSDPPSVVVYPNAAYAAYYPKLNAGNNTIDITYDELDMRDAEDDANYQVFPPLTFANPGGSVDLISTAGGVSTYRLFFNAVEPYSIYTLTLSEDITDVEGVSVDPAVVLVNDNDADDLPDDWETEVGLSPTSAATSGGEGRNGDFDDDGYTNYEEFLNRTDPLDDASFPAASVGTLILLPHDGAGIDDEERVPANASIAVFLADNTGFDVTDGRTVVMRVNDQTNTPYEVNLGDSGVVRTVKMNANDPDTAVKAFWTVYDRSLDTLGLFPFGALIEATINVTRDGALVFSKTCRFRIQSQADYDQAQDDPSLPTAVELTAQDPDFTDKTDTYNAGIQIESGPLAGAKIIYNDDENVVPVLAPSADIPPFRMQGVTAVGGLINLQPPTIFNTPVKIIIPTPGHKANTVRIYVYDGAWTLGCDIDGTSPIEGWMVPKSRQNRAEAVEIKVYHFSALQAGVAASQPDGTSTGKTAGESDESAGASCFVETAAGLQTYLAVFMLALLMVAAAIAVVCFKRKRLGG